MKLMQQAEYFVEPVVSLIAQISHFSQSFLMPL